ncbi:glycosyltransferase family 2 protein, partial [Alphaproteobacteria bacterium]|nr:glycosyltransferase family 2 protein [Alphaproteobacteria bacterium]
MKKISIVSTLYYSEETIEEFCDRVISEVERLPNCVPELILVDDGSPDNSRQLSLNLLKKDKRITLVELSKNFGHHHAMMAGLAQATGDFVFLIDSDLEEPPEVLREFFKCIKTEDLDVVYGKQKKRRGSLLSRFIGKIYYLTFRFLTGIDQPDDIVTCRLMSKGYVEALLLHKENELSIGGIWLQTGFRQKAVELVKGNTSKTTYT